MDDSPIALPALPQKATRPPFPWLAAAVPLLGGVVLWAVTGSAYSLLFALLGPVIAVASMLDSARGSRREQRAALVRHDDDIASAVKPELILEPQVEADGTQSVTYDFALDPERI